MYHELRKRGTRVGGAIGPDLTVLADGVNKPHNVSAILRTADAVGILGIHSISTSGAMRRHHMIAGEIFGGGDDNPRHRSGLIDHIHDHGRAPAHGDGWLHSGFHIFGPPRVAGLVYPSDDGTVGRRRRVGRLP